MITINNRIIGLNQFPDGTLRSKFDDLAFTYVNGPIAITWCYDNEAELFALECITDQLYENGASEISLILPYIPHARMDRVHADDGDIFTLKSFAKIINRMNFKRIHVWEAHSNVSIGMLNRVENHSCIDIAKIAIKDVAEKNHIKEQDVVLFFPDEGAMKRYLSLFENPYVFGMKNRDWKTGCINKLQTLGDVSLISGRDILIIDDISSYGGTFELSANALKAQGAAHVSLYVTHCEKSILRGSLIKTDLLDDIYTTDSIFTCNDKLSDEEKEASKKIKIIKTFRPEINL